jgi:hypothetical protein
VTLNRPSRFSGSCVLGNFQGIAHSVAHEEQKKKVGLEGLVGVMGVRGREMGHGVGLEGDGLPV